MAASAPNDITFTTEPGGATKASLVLDGRDVSRLWIIPYDLHIGSAVVRMDGIGGVGTEDDCRNRGYSRRVLESTVDHMRAGRAALSMLYGIPNFYPKFGFATAGPNHFVTLDATSPDAPLPAGWIVRPFAADDLPAVRRLYDEAAARTVGAAVRPADGKVWRKLLEPATPDAPDPECRVVVAPDGAVAGYAWLGAGFWYRRHMARDEPTWFVPAEAMATTPAAAEAVLDACRRWAAEPSATKDGPAKRLCLPLPPDHPVAVAATFRSADVCLRYSACGDSMARVLDVGRLLKALEPELAARLHASGYKRALTLRVRTDIGDGALEIRDGACRAVEASAAPWEGAVLAVPQTTLARLALGAFDPADLLARLDQPPTDDVRELATVLFPRRHQHMYLPDRY